MITDFRIEQIDKHTWRDLDGEFYIRENIVTGKKTLELTNQNRYPLLSDLARIDEYFKFNSIAKLQDVDGGDNDQTQ